MADKPDLSVTLGGGRPVRLKNPLLAASGTFGYGAEFEEYLDLNDLGGLVTKGISLEPRQGNAPPRTWETSCGMLNAIGLANLGLERFLADKLPYLARMDCVVAVNLYAESVEEFAELSARLDVAEGVDVLEVNVSCPNVKGGGLAFGVDPDMVGRVTEAVRKNSEKPVWVKLTPNVADPSPMAKAAENAGADGISLINTLLAMAINARTRKPRLANVMGGLSGPAIKPVGLRMTFQAARAVGIPVIGMGGIVSGEDAAEYLLAGASAVQVGTANFMDPSSMLRIVSELEEFCREQGLDRVESLVGGLKV